MGRSCTIMACADAHKDTFLQAAGLTNTGQPDPDHNAEFTGASDGRHFFLWRNPLEGKLLRRLDLKKVSQAVPFYHIEIVASVDGAATRRFEDGRCVWWIEGGKTGYAEIGKPPFSKDELIASWERHEQSSGLVSEGEPDAFTLAAEAFVLATGLRHEEDDALNFTSFEGQFPYAKPFWKFW
ncbi:hypothetical protein BC777_1393 [Yoonia maricola]|uniref:Uncharacterized protein n=1 Tax=Yoonia maricola TaxID=420999 RepID=A0A2M8WNN8_9RHOB|nr:hypothetical protein [Yoonia maricola]PJI92540.1 hypothetical protein BC777_1393 [Yoonia maricola]